MKTFAPVLSNDCEKSPKRSKAVGIVTKTGSVGVIVCGFSNEKKKKALLRRRRGPPSPNRGSGRGPPSLNPQML